MTPAEAAATIEALELMQRAAPRSVRLRQAFDQASQVIVLDEAADIPPAVYVAPAPGIDGIVRRRLNAIDRPKRTAKRKAQRRARRITRLHRKGAR